MARKVAPLTDSRCRQAKFAAGEPTRLYDGDGLFLELRPSGRKKWRFRYVRPGTGKQTTIAFGDYPIVSLAKARERRSKSLELLAEGRDPQSEMELIDGRPASPKSFEAIAKKFIDLRGPEWSEGYLSRISNSLENDAYPRFGKVDVDKISGQQVLDAVKAVEARGALEMAKRVLSAVSMVFDYAVATGKCRANPVYRLRKFLAPRPPVEHRRHVGKDGLPALMVAVEGYHGRPETRTAIHLIMRTFARTSELVFAQWPEFQLDDLDAGLWTIPAARMKGRKVDKAHGAPFVIPLPRQCVLSLRALRRLTGNYRYVFPGIRNPGHTPISKETINKALKIMGFEDQQTGHGFRGLASTILNEHGGFRPDAIEAQLHHKEKNKVRRAYNHAEYLDERRRMLQWWADYLDQQLAAGRGLVLAA